MATFSLTDLRNVVEKKYAPTIVENGDTKYELKNLLQMPSKQRNAVLALTEKVGADDDADLDAQVEVFKEILAEVVEGNKGQELIELIGDNAAVVVELATTWMDGTELGEA